MSLHNRKTPCRALSRFEWKYVPVRQSVTFSEESLCRGTQWVEFEPNNIEAI